MYNDVVPEENLAIYKLLYQIEVGLREFIIQQLEAQCGALWWRERLPSDVLEVFSHWREYERGITWCQLIPHHPIYYIDFADLKKVIERRANWRDAFHSVFHQKPSFMQMLSRLEPIRNKIAHNRKATAFDVQIVARAYQMIVDSIGDRRFLRLVSRCTRAEDLPQRLLRLREEAKSACVCCRECRPVDALEAWDSTRDTWWFDAGYLGHKVEATREYFGTLNAYRQLPRERGTGHRIEAWVESQHIEGKSASAVDELSAVLRDMEGG